MDATPVSLRPYQNDAVERAMHYSGYCLFLEQRTGKTPTALEIVSRRQPKRLLIVCPKIAIKNVWQPEIRRRWPVVPFEFKIIPISSASGLRNKMKRWKPDMMIVDEGHLIANPHSKQSRAVRSISRKVKYRLLLGGTPISEGIQKAWAQFDYIDKTIFGKWSSFKNRYLIYGGYGGYKIKGTKNLPDFQRKFHSRVYRLTLDEAQGHTTRTPTRIIRFPLEESAGVYDRLEKEFIAFLRSGEKIPVALAISRVMKLQQVAAGFIIDDFKTEHWAGDEKLRRLGLFLLRYPDEPLVVFVRFLRDMRRIGKLCERLGVSTTLVSAKNPFTGFASGVAIVQVQSGVAVDLSAAKHAIFYTWHYSQAQHDQAKFRIRYFGADEVRYSYLVAKDTIDEELYLAATRKEKFSRLILDRYRRKK